MARTTRRELMSLLGALGIVATLAGLALGLPAIDESLPDTRPVSADEPYLIGAGVTVIPPRGATLDVTVTRPGGSTGTVLFRLGSVQYQIAVRPFHGDLRAAGGRLRHRTTATSGYQVPGPQLEVATAGGLDGLQGGFTAPGRSGRYVVFVADGLTLEVTVSGADLDLGRTLRQIEPSPRTLRIDGRDR